MDYTQTPGATRETVMDSLLFTADSSFELTEPDFREISEKTFASFAQQYKTSCGPDSSGFISGPDVYVRTECLEICQADLAEAKTNRVMGLPCSYDMGIHTLLPSPGCELLILGSTYDGPDYKNFYEYRAEFYIYRVTSGIGLKGIKPAVRFCTKDWSLEELTWVNEKTIALKVYEETRIGDGSGLEFKYLKADLR